MGLVLAGPDVVQGNARVIVGVAFLIAYTLFRTIFPIRDASPVRAMLALIAEATAIGVLSAATGYFQSPLAFSLLTAVSVAGFMAGFGFSMQLGLASALAVGIPSIVTGTEFRNDVQLTSQWAVELLLVALVASYARRITGEAVEQHSRTLDQVSRLVDANDLLYNLHRLAQDLPESLDLDAVLDRTIQGVRDLTRADAIAVVLHEESDDSWMLARRYGGQFPGSLGLRDLPDALQEAVAGGKPAAADNLLRSGTQGLHPKSVSALYVPLVARGNVVGVVAIERRDFAPFSESETNVLARFSEPVALAVDNARWFTRLRTVGADEERLRIARDLHDRIGQSLAYLAFELDRVQRKLARDEEIGQDLTVLREDMRGVVREVRDTLYDLRTDVSDERSLPDTLEEYVRRVRERSGIEIVLRVDQTARLPRQQERELWRIGQEAIANAEKHSGCERIDAFWFCDGTEAALEVRDDGRGMATTTPARLDSYGIVGMRERASSIGASLAIDSRPGEGVTVRAALRPARS